ncbi:DUF2721 domain-containing protein [Pseudodesulfovibrio sp. zrk46]|uniref:DUF2721 domain-containing protein n=1 Tax=Pseudodesulfovibrio sp. zrk46 TaxID=2725288 RepID=UPI001449E007|nr:DUF2721 domain-containing protein [Pseudodesulfovibrio sp. zrk46]QJB55341.1 DUF2721 domain-containing protein [Pseudodesulfovibrio sp. zrk46]
MQISVTTPALLFPAISLFMLAYTNRFLSLGGRVRALHDTYLTEPHDSIRQQIVNLRNRIHMIKHMQGYCILAMICCIFSMLCLFQEWQLIGQSLFGFSLLFLLISLIFSYMEIRISLHALDILLGDMEDDN